MSQSTKNRSKRLAAYSALAGGVIPVTAAMGAFVGADGLNLVATPGNSVAVDMGAGYGEMFTFFVNTDSGSGTTGDIGVRGISTGSFFYSATSMFVKFNTANTGGWTNASVVRYNGFTPWPRNMSYGDFIDDAEDWLGMNQFSSQEHLLAGRFFSSSLPIYRGCTTCTSTFSFSSTFGDWAPAESGYVGLRFTKNEGVDYEYAWIRATANLDLNDEFAGANGGPNTIITSWGLQTTPNQGLPAGLPTPGVGALAMLAMGAAGVRRTRGRAA